MKALQTGWFTNHSGRINIGGGWLHPKFHFYSWALSAHLLFKHFSVVELVSDEAGIDLLVNQLGLPYSKTTPELNSFPDEYPQLWVLKKLFSYQLQDEPFLHVDSDAYLFQPIPTELLRNELIAQNYEFDHPSYIEAHVNAQNHLLIPSNLLQDNTKNLWAVNAGIIGGNNFLFYKSFYNNALLFLNLNRSSLNKINNWDYFNIYIEQLLIVNFAHKHNLSFGCLVEEPIGYPVNYKLDQFHMLPTDCVYIHAMNYKQNPAFCEQLAQRLRIENYELYLKTNRVCNELMKSSHFFFDGKIQYVPSPKEIHRNNLFPRTIIALTTICNSLTLKSFERLDLLNYLQSKIAELNEVSSAQVLSDLLSYELQYQAVFEDPGLVERFFQDESRLNALWKVNQDECHEYIVQINPLTILLESKWNWSPANEFALQRSEYSFNDNLLYSPSYHAVLLLPYREQACFKEYYLSPFEILLFDTLLQPSSVVDCVKILFAQIAPLQPALALSDIEKKTVNIIRFFSYFGVLLISRPSL